MKKFSTAVFFFFINPALATQHSLDTKALPIKPGIPTVAPIVTQKLSPRVRVEALAPASSASYIAQHFHSLRPHLLFLSPLDIILAPRISAMQAGLSLGGVHQSVFALGKLHQQTQFDVVRNWQNIIDPVNGQLIGIVGKRIGKVELLLAAEFPTSAHEFLVTQAWSELSVGDLLLPASSKNWSNVLFDVQTSTVPTPHGRIAALMREGLWGGAMDILAINLGSQHGIHPGATLSVLKQARMTYPSTSHNPTPPVMQAIATIFVFDVSERSSFALVMQANDVISIGDNVISIRALGK